MTLRKASGVKRIAVLGRSVRWETGVDDEKTYTRRLQQRLDVQFPRQFEVLNFAVGSYRPQQWLNCILIMSKILILISSFCQFFMEN